MPVLLGLHYYAHLPLLIVLVSLVYGATRTDRPASWWDVDFFPLLDADGFRGTLGKITPGPVLPGEEAPSVPESVANLRQRMLERLGQVYLGIRLPSLRRVAEQMRLASLS